MLGGVAGLKGGEHGGGLDLPDRRQVRRPGRAHESPRCLGAVVIMQVMSAGGVLVRCARVQIGAESGQRISAQNRVVPAAGRREACGGRGVHDSSLGPCAYRCRRPGCHGHKVWRTLGGEAGGGKVSEWDDFDWSVSQSQIAFVQVGGVPTQQW